MAIEARMTGARDPTALAASNGEGIRMKIQAIVAPALAVHFLARDLSVAPVKID